MKKISFNFVGGAAVSALDPKVQATINCGLAVVFDALNDVPGGVTPELLGDLQMQLATYHPGNPTSFQQWLTDGNNLLQQIATDTNNVKFQKDASFIGSLTQALASGKTVVGSLFSSLFAKHSNIASAAPAGK